LDAGTAVAAVAVVAAEDVAVDAVTDEDKLKCRPGADCWSGYN
jgi:hypothetical protein